MSNILKEEYTLKATKLGFWIIQIDTNTNTFHMIVDKSMKEVLGIKDSLSSEYYYQHWYNNISDEYYDYVSNAVQETNTSGKIIELDYTWNHPIEEKFLCVVLVY